jgi:archaellum component FlaF (FlaF/FlaG flagellin family)
MKIPTKAVSQTGVGTSEAISIKSSTRVSGLVKVEGTVNYTVEHSLDDINFIENTDVVSQSADIDFNYILPLGSVRVKVNSGTGTATLVIRQVID